MQLTEKEFFNYCAVSNIKKNKEIVECSDGKTFDWLEIKKDHENDIYLLNLNTTETSIIVYRAEDCQEITTMMTVCMNWLKEYLNRPKLRRYRYSPGLTPILINSGEVFGPHLEPLKTKEDVYLSLKHIAGGENEEFDLEKVLNTRIEITAENMMEVSLVRGKIVVPLEAAEGYDASTYLDTLVPHYTEILEDHKRAIIMYEKLKNELLEEKYGDKKDELLKNKSEIDETENTTSKYVNMMTTASDKIECEGCTWGLKYTHPVDHLANHWDSHYTDGNTICPYCDPSHPDYLKINTISTKLEEPPEEKEKKQIKLQRVIQVKFDVLSGSDDGGKSWTPAMSREDFFKLCESMPRKDNLKLEVRPLDGVTFDHYELRLYDDVIYRTIEGIIYPEDYRDISRTDDYIVDMSGRNKLRNTYEIWLREYKIEQTQKKLKEEIEELERSV